MKHTFTLTSLLALSLAAFALTGCDDQGQDQMPAQSTTEETMIAPSVMPPSDEAAPMAETAPVASSIQVEGATAYATTPASPNGAIFLTIHNSGSENDRLIGASTTTAQMVELHEGFVDEETGTMQMRKVDGIDVGAGQQVTLKPGGYHIMLMGLTSPLSQGDMFDVTLDFEKSADVVVPVTITAPGAGMEESSDGSMHNHDAMTDEDDMAQTPMDTTVPATEEPNIPSTQTDTFPVPEDEQPTE